MRNKIIGIILGLLSLMFFSFTVISFIKLHEAVSYGVTDTYGSASSGMTMFFYLASLIWILPGAILLFFAFKFIKKS